jgi:dipeptidase E
MNHLLLISNSTLYGSGYLDHAEHEMRDVLGSIQRVLFIPYALFDRYAYAAQARARFEAMGYRLESIQEARDPGAAVDQAEAIFVGGGNTFRLLNSLYENDLLARIRNKVEAGTIYIGSSAGSNVAAPTIKTTNDMPIIQPPSFEALHLVNYQINPHYLDSDPNSTHMGETREKRIQEFLEENDVMVVGLREGSMIRVENGRHTLKGVTNARVFKRDSLPVELEPGSVLTEA